MSIRRIGPAEKLLTVHLILDGKETQSHAADRLGINRASIQQWICIYKSDGEDAFHASKNKHYPKELKEQKLIGEYFLNLDRLITLHQNKYLELLRSRNFSLAISWEQRKLAELVTRYEDPVETPHDGYIRLGIRSHAKGTFHEYVEPGHELETAQMHRVAANKLIFNITFAWEHAVAITTEDDAGKLVSHRFPQFTLSESLRPEFLKYVILDEGFHHKLYLASPGGAGRNRVLKIDEALDYPIFYPSVEEQHKIGEFLNRLNDLITLHQREQNHIQIYDYRSILYGSF